MSFDDLHHFPPVTASVFPQTRGRGLREKTKISYSSTASQICIGDGKDLASEELTEFDNVGFLNLGNTCYLASSLQLMFATPSLLRQIREHTASICELGPEHCHWCRLRETEASVSKCGSIPEVGRGNASAPSLQPWPSWIRAQFREEGKQQCAAECVLALLGAAPNLSCNEFDYTRRTHFCNCSCSPTCTAAETLPDVLLDSPCPPDISA